MQVEYFEPEKHYEKVSLWWKEWKFPVVPLDHLPQTGFIVSTDSGTPLCAGFLYRTDSKFAVVEYIVRDPLANRQESHDSIQLLLETLTKAAKIYGHDSIHTSLHKNNSSLRAHLEASGYLFGDSDMLHFLKRTVP